MTIVYSSTSFCFFGNCSWPHLIHPSIGKLAGYPSLLTRLTIAGIYLLEVHVSFHFMMSSNQDWIAFSERELQTNRDGLDFVQMIPIPHYPFSFLIAAEEKPRIFPVLLIWWRNKNWVWAYWSYWWANFDLPLFIPLPFYFTLFSEVEC